MAGAQALFEVCRRDTQAVERNGLVARRNTGLFCRPVVGDRRENGRAADILQGGAEPDAARFRCVRPVAALVAVTGRDAQCVTNAVRRQQCPQGQVRGPPHARVEKILQVDSGNFAGYGFESVFWHSLPGLSPALPAHAHDIVERDASLRLAAQFQIERERDQRALGVIADDGICRVRILLVELGPGVEARRRDALAKPPAAPQHTRDRPAQQFEITLLGNQAGADQCQIVVIRRDSFEHPQQFGVALGREFIGCKRGGLHALHVPDMEVLVTREPEKCPVCLTDSVIPPSGQSVARTDEARRPSVLETAVAVARCVQQEQVSVEVRRSVDQRHVLLAQGLQVVAKTAHINPYTAADDQPVRNAIGLEFSDHQVADLDRVIDQLRIIFGLVGSEPVRLGSLAAHGGRNTPVTGDGLGWREDFKFARAIFLAFHGKEHARPVEVGMRVVEMGATHTEIVSKYFGRHGQRLVHRAGLPAAFVEFLEAHFAAVRFRANCDDVACVIANHVAAGDPGRHGKDLASRVRLVHGQGNLVQVCRRPGRLDAVSEH